LRDRGEEEEVVVAVVVEEGPVDLGVAADLVGGEVVDLVDPVALVDPVVVLAFLHPHPHRSQRRRRTWWCSCRGGRRRRC
jgi:hypothetical protein